MKTPLHRLEYIKNWMQENKDKCKGYVKTYYAKNKERKYQRQKDRYPEIKNKLNARKRERTATDPEYRKKRKNYRFNWLSKDPTHAQEILRKNGKLNYERHKDKMLDYMHERTKNLRFETIYWYSNGEMCCAKCGENHIEFLAIDHLNNNGTKERREHKGNFMKRLVSSGFPEGYQILCHNCNIIKDRELRASKNPTAAYNTYRIRAKKKMISLYSNGSMNCDCCGFPDIRALTFNHINGGGTKEFKSLSNISMSLHLFRLGYKRDDINVLCYNCNSAEGYYGECPHKSVKNRYL